MRIAIFDFDHTLYRGDSFLDFIRFARGRKAFVPGLVRLTPAIIRFWLGILPNWRLKELFFTHFFRGMEERELRAFGTAFSRGCIPVRIRRETMLCLQRHLELGHRVLVLTASSGIWLSDWCVDMGIDFHGTDFEVVHGRYTGRLSGKNCYGAEKKKFVLQLLQDHPGAETFGYGNAVADSGFLSLVNHANARLSDLC